jgi:TolA-binding protein
LDKLDRLDETERVGAGVDRANLGVSPDDISDEFDSLAAKMDDIEGRVVTIQEGLSNVADSQTVTQPLTSIEDRLRQIDGRLNELREGVSADEDSSVKELLGALDSEISAIEQRLGDIESQIEGEGGIGSIDFAGTASTDSDTSGFIDDDSSDIDELDDVDEEFDFDEAFLGVEDEEDAV